jgi:Domain of unknown function (DUF6899)
MPYIAQDNRKIYDSRLKDIVALVRSGSNGPGDLNYCFSRIVWSIFDAAPSYTAANTLLGVLEAVQKEFYRRKVVPYEDSKMIQNGDL